MDKILKSWLGRSLILLLALTAFYGLSKVVGSPLEQEEIDSPFPFSTEMPLAKQTIIVMVRETHQAALLLPTGPPGSKFIDPGPTIDPALLATPISTPAGDGYIVDSTYLSPRSQREFMLKNYWFEKKGREQITVYAGYDGVEQDQGTIYVSRPGAYRLERFDTPTRAGAVTIIDAIGEVLILESENGSTFYFNIPGLRYVQTPEEVVPTVTPEPTRTPDPLILEVLGSDDAPNFPGQLFSNRAINMDLQYLIDYAGDEDWFSFQVFYPGEVSFVLSDLPEDYRFVIFYNGYHAQTTRIGENLDTGTGDKQFYLPDAVVGEYLVVVFGDDNSFNATAPYTIHFRAPNPYPVLPLLHCVERVAEGEYIAHFGYENRYDFVRVIPVGRANYLDPPPRDRLQLTIFNLGREEDSFEVNFDGSPLIWYLDQSSVAASENSPSCTALRVDIDIKPNSEPNCFNNDGHGMIPIAILSSPNFDALTIDPLSVSLDGQGIRLVGKGNIMSHEEDVNGDGLVDLVVQIEDIDGIYLEGDTVGVLTATTYAGQNVFGDDTICIRP